MKDNIINVLLWGREICKLKWNGGYKPHFGKLGSIVSFHPDYVSYGWDLDPIGPYNHSIYMVRQGPARRCSCILGEGTA